jgi:hypothetical protein
MPDHVSTDEFLTARKHYVKSGDTIVKAIADEWLKANKLAPSSWNDKDRTIRFIMSAEVEDRDRDIIIQQGIDLTKFLDNPVAPLMHRSYDFSVGTWKDVEPLLNGRPKRHEGTLQLLAEGVEPNADRLARHISAGSIRACSIGFIPRFVVKRDVPDDKKQLPYYYPGYEVREAELLECSPCLIPANPDALAKMAKDGDTISREIIEEVLDNWARDPVSKQLLSREEFEKAQKEATGGRTSVVVSPPPSSPEVSPETVKQDLGQPPVEPARRTVEIPHEVDRTQLRGFAALLAKFFPDMAEKARIDAEIKAMEEEEAAEAEARAKAEAAAKEKAEIDSLARDLESLEVDLTVKGIRIGA